MKGLVRLKALMDGDAAKRQVTTTLRCMQTLSRVQSQVQSRRIRLTEEKQALQRLKREQELAALKTSVCQLCAILFMYSLIPLISLQHSTHIFPK